MTALLSGKQIVITGAGRGLGQAYALACAAHGAHVVANDIDADAVHATCRSITRAGGSATPHVGSVTHWDSARELIELATRSGTLDGVVLNAAIHHRRPPWEETERSITRIVEVNVLGAQFTGVHAMKAMLATVVHQPLGLVISLPPTPAGKYVDNKLLWDPGRSACHQLLADLLQRTTGAPLPDSETAIGHPARFKKSR